MEDHELRRILSANIKLYRNRREWSQVKLAEKLDISPNFLADIETGKSWVSSVTLVKLANVLNIEVYELFKPVGVSGEAVNEKTTKESKEIMTRLVRDMSLALNKSVTEAMNQSLENIGKQYIS
jgi:transcriptional regulator with XRE-family HTH domain